MKKRIITLFLVAFVFLSGCELNFKTDGYGFSQEIDPQERQARLKFVETAQQWLGSNESDGSYKPIIDIYNAHEPLARGYTVQYTDLWCATFVSTVSIQCEFTDIIPTECGCERQIELFMELRCWVENDAYIPLPGDIIYYATNNTDEGDCTDWSNHVGIVVGTKDDSIKVIEGNNNAAVRYRYIKIDEQSIRGFAIPDFSA